MVTQPPRRDAPEVFAGVVMLAIMLAIGATIGKLGKAAASRRREAPLLGS
jgi:hypothetical protein